MPYIIRQIGTESPIRDAVTPMMTLATATTSWFEFADAHLPLEGFNDTANTVCRLDVEAAC
jgi:hypothetical protein